MGEPEAWAVGWLPPPHTPQPLLFSESASDDPVIRLVNLPSICAWAGFGVFVKKLIRIRKGKYLTSSWRWLAA
jgi:hypothetical protein